MKEGINLKKEMAIQALKDNGWDYINAIEAMNFEKLINQILQKQMDAIVKLLEFGWSFSDIREALK